MKSTGSTFIVIIIWRDFLRAFYLIRTYVYITLVKGNDFTIDSIDSQLLAKRRHMHDDQLDSRLGDYVEFANGRTERSSHHWGGIVEPGARSFYLGDGYTSFSGGLSGFAAAITQAKE